MVTERWKSGACSLCEEVVVEHGTRRRGACARRRRSRLCQKRQHSGCVFPFPVLRPVYRGLGSLSVEFVAGARRRSEKSLATELARSRSVDASCVVALSLTAANRCVVDRLAGDVRRRLLCERVKSVDHDVSCR